MFRFRKLALIGGLVAAGLGVAVLVTPSAASPSPDVKLAQSGAVKLSDSSGGRIQPELQRSPIIIVRRTATPTNAGGRPPPVIIGGPSPTNPGGRPPPIATTMRPIIIVRSATPTIEIPPIIFPTTLVPPIILPAATTQLPPVVIPAETTEVPPIAPAVTLPPAVLPSPVVATVQAPTSYQSPLVAYINAAGNVEVTSLGVNPGATALTSNAGGTPQSPYSDEKVNYSYLRWSPDGTALLFTSIEYINGTSVSKAYIAESGQALRLVASGIAGDFGAVWSPDGAEVGYAIVADSTDPFNQTYQLQAVPRAGGTPRAVGTFKMTYFGEGVPDEDPADSVVRGESYLTVNPATAWLPNGILHPKNGIYNVGIELTAFDGTLIAEQPEAIRHPVLSPDKSRIVAIASSQQGEGVVLIDAKTLQVQTTLYSSADPIEAVGWGTDSQTVYFSVAKLSNTIQAQNNAIAQQINYGMGVKANIYDVTLWRSDVSNTNTAALFTVKGRSIRDIAGVNDNLIVFSYIESSERQVNAINAGDSSAAALGARSLIGTYVTGGAVTFFDKDSRRPAVSPQPAPFTAVGG